MSMLLVKMSMQNIEFQKYSPSVLVLATFYAATAFLKHSKKWQGELTNKFCTDVRQIIFKMAELEKVH